MDITKAGRAPLAPRRKDKGFTLMEMLIVVGIIAILVAIAIPVFTGQLHKAKIATDEANIRSGYAAATATFLTDSSASPATTYYLKKDGSVTTTAAEGDFTTTEATNANDTITLPGGTVTSWDAGKKVSYTISTTDDTVTINII